MSLITTVKLGNLGKDINIILHAFASIENIDVDDSIREETERGILRGELLHFDVEIFASEKNTGFKLGSVSLGSCIYESVDEFITANDYVESMVYELKDEVKKYISVIKNIAI